MELRPTASGGLGLYPEHAANLAWLTAQVAAQLAARAESAPEPGGATTAAPLQVLNLFAHTGLATLALARAGAAVVHVDGARSAVAWARRNAELSGLADRPVRWLVDDAAAFIAREARRGRRYDGIVLDPPAFGRAAGREWRLEEDLPDLLAACRAVAAPGAFVLLTAHSESVDGTVLATLLRTGFGSGAAEVVTLDLTATSGARLALGWSVRRGS
jgi:23S rRNA (cytosine1962-C5)-methyltransferase